jgi:hypothetical protein
MLNVNKKTDKKLVNSGWGGYREKAGRKPTWNQKETTTIRIPKAFEQEVMKYARALDAGLIFDNETDSSELRDENIVELNFDDAESIYDDFDYETDSNLRTISGMPDYSYLETKTESRLKYRLMPSFMNAVFLAREIVLQKKCARISLGTFISRFYSIPFNSKTLKSDP